MGVGDKKVEELGEEKRSPQSSTRPAGTAMLCPGCSPTNVRLRMGTGAHSVGCPRGHQFKLCLDPRDAKTQWLEVVVSPTPGCKRGQRFRVPTDAVIA